MTSKMLPLCLLAGILCSCSCFERFIYYPEKNLAQTPEAAGLAYEDIMLKTSDEETIHCWYIPAEGSRYCVIFCHGNAGNMSNRVVTAEIIHKLGLNLVLFDYRGFGKSTGQPDVDGTARDADAVWQHVTSRGFRQENVVIWGRSLGGGVAIELASRHSVAALIVESSFTGVDDLAWDYCAPFPANLFFWSAYPSARRIEKLDMPVLVIHSRDDEVIPFAHGEELYYLAPGRNKRFLPISGAHNNGFYQNRILYTDTIHQFLMATLEEYR